ncbi:MAG: adenylate/guanylate cyclase domain-containing protein [Pseudomonadota bacterium]
MNSSVSTSPTKPGFAMRWFMPIAAILFACILAIPLTTRFEPLVGDILLPQNQKEAPNSQTVVIVAITEETLAQFPYRSPIDRGFLADLLLTIQAGAPQKIGVDILLDSPSDPAKDQRLFSVVGNAAVPIVLASAGRENGLTEKQVGYLKEVLKDQVYGSIVLQRDTIDGVVRHLPSLQNERAGSKETFAQVLAERTSKQGIAKGRILYQTKASEPFPIYPAHTAELLPPDWFKDKIVLIGTMLPNTDRHLVPASVLAGVEDETLSGIEVHAQILEQLLADRSLPTVSAWQSFTAILVSAIFSMLAFSLVANPNFFFLGMMFTIGIYLFAGSMLASAEIILIPLIGPPAAALLAALLFSLFRWWQDRSEREFLEVAFSQYVSKSIVKRLTSGNLQLSLGGEKRLVTYLFTDLEGFTRLSQSLPPDQMGSLLNTYLDRMCDRITAHGATIDKIIGDAVVCFFGAPDADQNQAENAVRLALQLDKLCQDFRRECDQDGIRLGVTRIGLHMGDAIIGNFGGKRFFDYTGIGDTVNTAARLESVNRHLGTRICASETIVQHSPELSFRPIGELVLKGRNTALPCFEPCSTETLLEPWMQVYLSAYRHLERQETKAIERFEEAALLNPDDGPTRFHLERLKKEGIVDAQVTMWEK